jgi:hypothetical protein
LVNGRGADLQGRFYGAEIDKLMGNFPRFPRRRSRPDTPSSETEVSAVTSSTTTSTAHRTPYETATDAAGAPNALHIKQIRARVTV